MSHRNYEKIYQEYIDQSFREYDNGNSISIIAQNSRELAANGYAIKWSRILEMKESDYDSLRVFQPQVYSRGKLDHNDWVVKHFYEHNGNAVTGTGADAWFRDDNNVIYAAARIMAEKKLGIYEKED